MELVRSPLGDSTVNPTPSKFPSLQRSDADSPRSLQRPRGDGSKWASFFVSVIVHINLLLILAVTLKALQKETEPPLVIDTTFVPGEEEQETIADNADADVVEVENVVFAEAAPMTAEEMVRKDSALDLPGLKGLGGALGIGGGSGGGGVGFFGTSARGKSFVFVVDCSGSMQGHRFKRAVSELEKSLRQLDRNQEFQILFFNSQAIPLVHSLHKTKLLPATPSVLAETRNWIDQQAASGGTNPNDALERALALNADVVFFLTDAQRVPRTVRTLIDAHNEHGSTVHTIAFGHRGGETLMKGIASDHHGRYRFVP